MPNSSETVFSQSCLIYWFRHFNFCKPGDPKKTDRKLLNVVSAAATSTHWFTWLQAESCAWVVTSLTGSNKSVCSALICRLLVLTNHLLPYLNLFFTPWTAKLWFILFLCFISKQSPYDLDKMAHVLMITHICNASIVIYFLWLKRKWNLIFRNDDQIWVLSAAVSMPHFQHSKGRKAAMLECN